MSAHKTTDTWSWPIDATQYDQAHGLTARERRFLTVELPSRIKFSKTRQPSLDTVQRLARPLHDVFDHIEFREPKRRSLVFYLLEEMGRRDRTLWAWTDAEWMELVECRRYDGIRIVAAAFLLRGFDTLASFPKRRHVYSCLARRVFGFKAFAAVEKRAKARLQELGYRIRTLRLVPLTLAQLLLIARSPRIEDITETALLQLQKQTGTVALDTCVIALSRLLVSEGIIEQPVRRLGLQPKPIHGAPEVIVADVPGEWARLARYWHETTTLTPGTDGDARLAALRASDLVPTPTAILSTSPGKYQALWRVAGFDFECQEQTLKLLAQAFGGDPACTDRNRVLRIPGFLNRKYSPAHPVTVEYPVETTYGPTDFRLDDTVGSCVLPLRGNARKSPPVKHSHSEDDWAWVCDQLAHGEDAVKLTRELAVRRSDKADPLYYAQRTVDVASARLWLADGIGIDDVITMLEVRRRFEIPVAIAGARAREIAATAQRMIARRKTA